ncbi:MAG: GNAT family N-acetyltransferase [Lachnospiraceae bacterium]|nr:GNAT family N-acetyltransferase [Lachnospiraceae bacterium]
MTIRPLQKEDQEELLAMMRVFYDSPALIHKTSTRALQRDIDACLDRENPFVEAWIFTSKDGKEIQGYAMISKSYTTEYGGLCIWVEDLYIKPAYRHSGMSKEFFAYIERAYPEAVRFKLEVEEENEHAIQAYQKSGYAISDYYLMTKEMDPDL